MDHVVARELQVPPANVVDAEVEPHEAGRRRPQARRWKGQAGLGRTRDIDRDRNDLADDLVEGDLTGAADRRLGLDHQTRDGVARRRILRNGHREGTGGRRAGLERHCRGRVVEPAGGPGGRLILESGGHAAVDHRVGVRREGGRGDLCRPEVAELHLELLGLAGDEVQIEVGAGHADGLQAELGRRIGAEHGHRRAQEHGGRGEEERGDRSGPAGGHRAGHPFRHADNGEATRSPAVVGREREEDYGPAVIETVRVAV